MDGKNIFSYLTLKNNNEGFIEYLTKLKNNLNNKFRFFNNRRYVEIEKGRINFFQYMKKMAYMNYRRKNFIRIVKRKYLGINKNDLDKIIKRKNSHSNFNNEKKYHILIYRNLSNYKYKPYVLPLKEEDKRNFLFTEGEKNFVKKNNKNIKKTHLDKKYKELVLIYEKLNRKKEINNFKNFKKSNFTKIYKKNYSLPILNIQKNKNKNLNLFPSNKSNLEIKKNDSFCSRNVNNIFSKNSFFKSLSFSNKGTRAIFIPKFNNECISAIKSLNKIENNIKSYIYKNEREKKKEKEKSDYVNIIPKNIFKIVFKKNKNSSGFMRYQKYIISPKKNYINKSANLLSKYIDDPERPNF